MVSEDWWIIRVWLRRMGRPSREEGKTAPSSGGRGETPSLGGEARELSLQNLICFSMISWDLTSQMEFRSEAVQRQQRMESIQTQFSCILAIRSGSSSKPGRWSLSRCLQQWGGQLAGKGAPPAASGASGTFGTSLLAPLGSLPPSLGKPPSSALCFQTCWPPIRGQSE